MTIDYSKGKIYKIEPIVEHDEKDIYIGSTTQQYLCQRFGAHKTQYTKWLSGNFAKVTSFELFEKYGVENLTSFSG